MPKPSNQKKLLLRIGFEPFLEAQEHRCPLCGVADWDDRPEPNGYMGHEKNYPALPYYSMTWDHVIPEAKGGAWFGNVLVVHNGCNSRKAKAKPLPHEIAMLKIVNERLGWDGATYANTPLGRRLYEHLQQVADHAGVERMIEISDPVMVANFLLRKGGIDPTPPPLIDVPSPTTYYPPKRPKKPSKGVLLPQIRHHHLVIRPAGEGAREARGAAGRNNA